MKVILNVFLMGLVLTSFMAKAEDYPAANFQPKVLYSDTDYKPPASAAPSSSTAAESSVSVDDSKYPATNFQPKVLFSDESVASSSKPKVKKIVKKSVPAKKSTSNSKITPSASIKPQNKEEDSSMTILLGLVVLGVAGYLYTQKTKKPAKVARRRATFKRVVVASSRAGASGVTKYLKARDKPVRAAKKKVTRRKRSPAKK
jgi:hypothetical protein